MICNECGYENNDDGQFCSQCGLPLSIDEKDIGKERPSCPKLSKKVPYVIPGEATGYIPLLHADDEPEIEDFQVSEAPLGEGDLRSDKDEDSKNEDDNSSGDGCLQPAEADIQERSCADLLGDQDDGVSHGSQGEGELSGEFAIECDELIEKADENEPEDRSGIVADCGKKDPDDQKLANQDSLESLSDDGNHEESKDVSQMTIPFSVAGLASWDHDFPVAQDTAVMPDPEEIIQSCEWSDEEEEGDSKPEEQIDEAMGDCQDLSNAKTVKLDRVPALDPSSTAVIPSISVSGPRRYSDADRDANIKRPSKGTVLLVVVAVLAMLLVAVLGIRACESRPQVPDVVGMTSQEARARVESVGFEVQVDSVVAEDADAGTVLKSNPKAGARRGKGSAVVLTVASSQVVPDVVGVDLESATKMLEEQGAKNIKVNAEASNQPENTVIAVSPEVGDGFDVDSEIVLTVATSATLPDVKGMIESDAVNTLEEAGYKTEIKWVDSEEAPRVILETEPQAGELANLGSTVKLEMSSPGPSSLLRIMDYFDVSSEDDSGYLQWKGFSVTGSYSYSDTATGQEYASQIWFAKDGTTVSFTPAPYIEDKGLDMVDYLGQGFQFQGVRLFIPAKSALSLGVDPTIETIEAYMEECQLDDLIDSCTGADLEYNGQRGSTLGVGGNFICAQGETEGRIWTILITESGTYIGAGGLECYPNMDSICDAVAVNEILTTQK